MVRLRHSLEIGAHPESIWSLLVSDLGGAEARYRSSARVSRADGVDPKPAEVGWGNTTRDGSKAQTPIEFTDIDPPHRLGWRFGAGAENMRVRGVVQLRPAGIDRADVQVTLVYTPRTVWARLLEPFIRLLGGLILRRFLARLKLRVEARGSFPP